jgi:hypothetical protein
MKIQDISGTLSLKIILRNYLLGSSYLLGTPWTRICFHYMDNTHKLSDVPFVITYFFMSKTRSWKHRFFYSFLMRSCTTTLTAQAWVGPTSIPRGAV